jgi:CubicO group peptidase (beta-lactamase class C family)
MKMYEVIFSKKRRFCFILLIALLMHLGAHSQTSNFTKIDSVLLNANTKGWVAGSAALVMKDGKILYDKAFGFKDREAEAAMQTNDIFRIASMTKPVVSVAALILIERGKLKLDDPVYKYIPEFKSPVVIKEFNPKDSTFTTEPANTDITVRQLLTHTSGIGYGFQDKELVKIYSQNSIPDLATTENVMLADKMKKLGTLPLFMQPGKKFHYGLSTDVLGYVVEVASGEKLDAFIAENILKRLQMNDTQFYIPDSKKDRLVTMYGDVKGMPLFRLPYKVKGNDVLYPISGARTYFSGGSGLTSTTHDYGRFLQMILNGGKLGRVRILNKETIAQMTTNQVGSIALRRGNKFGFGLEIEQGKKAINGAKPGKLFWGGAFNTTFWIDPSRNAIAVLMTQVYPALHSTNLFNGFETAVNQTLDN